METPSSPPRRPVRLRALLYDAGWSRTRLARALGTSVQTACRVFDGERPLTLPEADLLVKIWSEQLGRRISVDDLIDRSREAAA